MTKRALIIVDVQNDFVEGGSLAVVGGKKVAADIAKHLDKEGSAYDLVVFTQDWHIDPGTHWSQDPDFVDTWPVHCAGGTQGAELVSEVHNGIEAWQNKHSGTVIRIIKGLWTAAYSGFEGSDPITHKTLTESLEDNEIVNVDVAGIATDHCVRATALDALSEGFNVTVLDDLIAGVAPEPSQAALNHIHENGGTILHSSQLAL